jgi:tRNA(fMet)-specific endonuclease VapC
MTARYILDTKRANPARLVAALEQVLLHMDVLAWSRQVAQCYGKLCTNMEQRGINLSDLDMMTPAHAISEGATLVSRDKAFLQLHGALAVEVW